jgi:hypothetical protein
MSNVNSYSNEDMAKIITVAIFGYVTGVTKVPLIDEQLKNLYEGTLAHLEEGGLLEEFIEIYDSKLYDEVQEELKDV